MGCKPLRAGTLWRLLELSSSEPWYRLMKTKHKRKYYYFFTLKVWASFCGSPGGHLLSGPEFPLSLFLHTPIWTSSGILYGYVPWPMELTSKDFTKIGEKGRKLMTWPREHMLFIVCWIPSIVLAGVGCRARRWTTTKYTKQLICTF